MVSCLRSDGCEAQVKIIRIEGAESAKSRCQAAKDLASMSHDLPSLLEMRRMKYRAPNLVGL